MDNQFLKYVMEGMGVQPTDNIQENWNTIMNFVPSYSGNPDPNSNINGPIVKLTFKSGKGGNPIELDCPETMLLKDVITKFARKANLSNEYLNNVYFLCNGRKLDLNKQGTIKSNNLKNGSQIVVVDLN